MKRKFIGPFQHGTKSMTTPWREASPERRIPERRLDEMVCTYQRRWHAKSQTMIATPLDKDND